MVKPLRDVSTLGSTCRRTLITTLHRDTLCGATVISTLLWLITVTPLRTMDGDGAGPKHTFLRERTRQSVKFRASAYRCGSSEVMRNRLGNYNICDEPNTST
jgi:hypothetical protein